jgi:flagellar L-ring protein precursor FlgH
MKRFFLLAMILLQSGCASILNPTPRRDPAFAAVRPQDMLAPPQYNAGAIFQSGYDIRLFEDNLARRVGDVLTVRLVERTNAKKDADTDVKRNGSTSISVPTILGQNNAKLLGYELSSSLDSKHDFKGEGESKQSNALTGNISVTVVEALPNGNLRVRGEKRVSLNQGHEYVKLSGIVRPADIDTTNTVDSTRIADATIMYTGEGAVADVNRMGWLQRFFTSILFPF